MQLWDAYMPLLVACFSDEASAATIVHALQQLKIQKVYTCWVPQHLTEEHWKNHMKMVLNFLTQYKEDRKNLREWIITGDKSWIHFYEPERKSASMVRKKRKKKHRENSRMSGLVDRWH